MARYNGAMEVDFITNPEGFAAANAREELKYLRSLTLESAAERLEDILDSWVEFSAGLQSLNLPPPLPNPLPGPTLAILLEGKPSPED